MNPSCVSHEKRPALKMNKRCFAATAVNHAAPIHQFHRHNKTALIVHNEWPGGSESARRLCATHPHSPMQNNLSAHAGVTTAATAVQSDVTARCVAATAVSTGGDDGCRAATAVRAGCGGGFGGGGFGTNAAAASAGGALAGLVRIAHWACASSKSLGCNPKCI